MPSIVFFPLFLILTSLYAFIGKKYGNYHKNFLIWILICIFVFFIGVRVNFGNDHATYLHMYYFQDASLLRCEKLYVCLNQFLRSLNAPYQLLFAIIAFIEIFTLLFVFEKANVNIFFGYILFYLLYLYAYLNILRQAIAMSFVLLGIIYYSKRKYIHWIIFTLIAFGFHISAVGSLILIPIISIVGKIKFHNLFYYILIFLSSMFFERMFDLVMEGVLIPLNIAFGKSASIINAFLTFKIPLGSGMGVRLRGISYICMLPLLLDYKSKNKLNNFYFSVMYFGILGEFVSSVNMNLSRIFMYYSIVQLIVLPKIISSIKPLKLKNLKVKEILFLVGLFFIFLLTFVQWINGSNTTSIYQWSLDFDLLKNHSF